ncbi:hypothetical protein H5410_062937 [Solanum commersonii]|uniref:Uncharacterized protein n=1 Tax=Solanum commersonii TaxID=4109 RepID=A0A9J5WBT1_SOLCO|nr:hypothetical protein H5410_062937 [Solanum commersonii]
MTHFSLSLKNDTLFSGELKSELKKTKHIKALLLRRHGSVKPNAAAIPEGEETKGANLDKSFGFSKQFASKYEIGEEMGRGHFGYTCSAIVKIGELKGQKVVVKELITLGLLEWNKSRVTSEIPKYGKKVPKNTISVVAGFTVVYWGCPLGAKKTDPFILDNKTLSQAHAYLLGNCDEIQEYIRTDVPETVIDVPSKEFVTQQLEVEYEKEFEDESEEEFEDEFEKECEDGSENEYEDDSKDESKDELEDDTP